MFSIEKYLSYEKKDYFFYYTQILQAAKKLGNFSKQKKLIVAIPVSSNEKQLYKTLLTYKNQTLSAEYFEIVLFLNRGMKDSLFTHLERSIHKAQKILPFEIKYIKKTFRKSITMGYLRKFLIDSLLIYTNKLNIVIVNNDADSEYIDNSYLQEILNSHSPGTKTITYRKPDIPLWIQQYPMFNKLSTFYYYIDELENKIQNEEILIRVNGANFSFTTELYALNGGYSAVVDIGEDLYFCYEAQRKFTKKIFKKTKSRLISSYRRITTAYLLDLPLYRAWDTFKHNQVRSISEKKLFISIAAKEKVVNSLYFQREVEKFFNYFLHVRIKRQLLLANMRKGPQMQQAFYISKEIFSTALKKMKIKMNLSRTPKTLYILQLKEEQ